MFTMTTTSSAITLIVILSVGILMVTVDGECQPTNGPIENCCCLGYNNNNYNAKSSGVYIYTLLLTSVK